MVFCSSVGGGGGSTDPNDSNQRSTPIVHSKTEALVMRDKNAIADWDGFRRSGSSPQIWRHRDSIGQRAGEATANEFHRAKFGHPATCRAVRTIQRQSVGTPVESQLAFWREHIAP